MQNQKTENVPNLFSLTNDIINIINIAAASRDILVNCETSVAVFIPNTPRNCAISYANWTPLSAITTTYIESRTIWKAENVKPKYRKIKQNRSLNAKIFLFTFSTVTQHKTKTFPYALDNEPMKTFGCRQLSITSAHGRKECAGLRPYSTSMFALFSVLLKFAELHNHSLH